MNQELCGSSKSLVTQLLLSSYTDVTRNRQTDDSSEIEDWFPWLFFFTVVNKIEDRFFISLIISISHLSFFLIKKIPNIYHHLLSRN